MNAPERFARYIRENGYDSRSDKHSNALMRFIVGDLVSDCASIRREARTGELVYAINHAVTFQNETWNIDLAIGPPRGNPVTSEPGQMRQAQPASIRLAVEGKAIMTKHAGARLNRRRDMGAFRDYMENYDPRIVRGGITILNMAPTFRSTLSGKVNRHPHITETIRRTVTIFQNIPLRTSGSNRGTVDANCLLVISYDGEDRSKVALGTIPPAPRPTDPVSYETFITRLGDAYAWTWMRGPRPTHIDVPTGAEFDTEADGPDNG